MEAVRFSDTLGGEEYANGNDRRDDDSEVVVVGVSARSSHGEQFTRFGNSGSRHVYFEQPITVTANH